MHCTFFLLSCALKVFAVLLFFFLSLSFSLLIMVPKNFVPSKNLIRRGSLSSSLPSDFVQFRDEKARNDFFKNFYDQTIHSEH